MVDGFVVVVMVVMGVCGDAKAEVIRFADLGQKPWPEPGLERWVSSSREEPDSMMD